MFDEEIKMDRNIIIDRLQFLESNLMKASRLKYDISIIEAAKNQAVYPSCIKEKFNNNERQSPDGSAVGILRVKKVDKNFFIFSKRRDPERFASWDSLFNFVQPFIFD